MRGVVISQRLPSGRLVSQAQARVPDVWRVTWRSIPLMVQVMVFPESVRLKGPARMASDVSTVHAIDCRNENELLMAEITAWRVQKIVLKPGTKTTTTARTGR